MTTEKKGPSTKVCQICGHLLSALEMLVIYKAQEKHRDERQAV